MQPTTTIVRPELTPEEREARMAEVRKAVADFCIACARQTAQNREGERT